MEGEETPTPGDDNVTAEPTPTEGPKGAVESAADDGTAEAREAIRATLKAVIFTTFAITIGTFAVVDLGLAVAAFAGGVLAAVNLVLFARLVQAILSRKGNAVPLGVLGALKMVGLFVCVFVLIRRGGLSGLGLALGYSALPIGITLRTLFGPSAKPTQPT